MQLKFNQLTRHLQQSLAPIYLIHSDEILLRQEARDAIRQAGIRAGYQEYQRLEVDHHFDWQQLKYECNSRSLFTQKTLIELVNPHSKFDQTAAKVLIEYSQHPAPDKLLLMTCGKLSAAQQKSAWLQALQSKGVSIAIPLITYKELPQWIDERARQAKLVMDRDSMQLLAQFTEGNLLACQQAIVKLSLLYSNEPVKIQHISAVIDNQARFNVFALGDAVLQGEVQRVQIIMQQLQAEGVEPPLILWALTRELRTLIEMLTQRQQGQSLSQVLSKVWPQRQALYQAALSRIQLSQAYQWLQLAHTADTMIKGMNAAHHWQLLLRLSLAIAGCDPLPKLLACDYMDE